MSLLEVSIWTDMVTEVETQKAVYGFEYHQVTNAIVKFREFFTTNRERYSIPQALLTELNGYIAEFPAIQFGDMDNASYQNPIVECLRIICQLVQYNPVDKGSLLYRYAWYTSPLLMRYYTAWIDGHYDNWWNGSHVASFDPQIWRLSTLGGLPAGYFMGTFEHWFMVNRNYGAVDVILKARLDDGVVGQPSISVYYLTSGQPEPLFPITGRESITTRGDVTIKASKHFNWDGVSGEKEWVETVDVDAFISYVVVVLRDDFSDGIYRTQLREVSA